jgi:hypothetical protein
MKIRNKQLHLADFGSGLARCPLRTEQRPRTIAMRACPPRSERDLNAGGLEKPRAVDEKNDDRPKHDSSGDDERSAAATAPRTVFVSNALILLPELNARHFAYSLPRAECAAPQRPLMSL